MEASWVIRAKRADFYGLADRFGLDPVVIRCIANRGAASEAEIRRYLEADWRDEYDPHRMLGAEQAASEILEAVRSGEKIMIASDYDVDGVMSGRIFLESIRDAGGDVFQRAPNRIREGYGLSRSMVEDAAAQGVSVIVTCDNGIAAFEAAKRAEELGIRLIITDHHECQFEVTPEGKTVTGADGGKIYRFPKSSVVVDPHQPGETYPFKGLCGAGVAYKVCRLLYELQGRPREESLHLLEYAGIATVVDVMDLVDENRILAKEALVRVPRTENPGLRALLSLYRLDGREKLAAWHFGFEIGPCLNSAGRLADAGMAMDLLDASEEEAPALARKLKELNDSRKSMTAEGVESAERWIASRPALDDVLVIPVPDLHESIAGLTAGKLREKYHHPVIVLTRSGHGDWKGSGRSVESWDMFAHLMECRSLMTKFGGHPMAAGLSLPEENIDAFRARLNETSGLTEDDFKPIIKLDAAMPIDYIRPALIEQLKLLEPCGKGNPDPLFAEKDFHILSARLLGKQANVLKLSVQNSAGCRMDAVWFGPREDFENTVRGEYGEDSLRALYGGRDPGVHLMLAYVPVMDDYWDPPQIQMQIQAIGRAI